MKLKPECIEQFLCIILLGRHELMFFIISLDNESDKKKSKKGKKKKRHSVGMILLCV